MQFCLLTNLHERLEDNLHQMLYYEKKNQKKKIKMSSAEVFTHHPKC